MEQFELLAERRDTTGTAAARRMRLDGKVPVVLYGDGKETVHLSTAFNALMHQLESEAFYSHILTLDIEGSKEKVVLRDLHRDPARGDVMHVDLMRVSATKKLHMTVPLHFVNADKSPGVKTHGGVVSHQLNEVEVSCLATNLPSYIEVDLSAVELGDTIHLSDLALPEGVSLPALGHESDSAVATVHLPRGSVADEAEDAEAAEEAGAAEEGGEES